MSSKKTTKIINLFGGPGIGKSTVAAGLFHLMKTQQMDVELVTEYAKDLVWEGREKFLRDPDQLYIFAQQYRRISRLIGKVEYAITDSPILFSMIYTQKNPHEFMERFILDVWDTFENQNFVLRRGTEFVDHGRAQSLAESLVIDEKIRTVLNLHAIPYINVTVGTHTPHTMLDSINYQSTLA